MKILLAPNSFKGSFTSCEAAKIFFSALRPLLPHDEISLLPLGDGGDGTMEAIKNLLGGDVRYFSRGDEKVPVLFFDDGSVFIEMAKANTLIPKERKGPLLSSSFETGLLMRWALESEVKSIVLGLGGSLSTDGGTGMAKAFGYRFLDKDNNELSPSGESLLDISSIVIPTYLHGFSLTMLSDVTNPLFGPNGAAYVYGPQKGADQKMVKRLDDGLMHFSGTFFSNLNPNGLGMGAAGGMGFGGTAFFHGKTILGSEWMLKREKASEALLDADIIVSGEGKVDSTSFSGKVLGELIKRKGHAKVYVVAGSSSFSNPELLKKGVEKIAFCQEYFGRDGKLRSASSLAKAVSSLF